MFPYESGQLIPWDGFRDRFPSTAEYLSRHRGVLDRRDRGRMRGPSWYGYSRNQALTIMETSKLLTPDYYAHASFSYDSTGHAFFCGGGAGGYGIVVADRVDPRTILGVLNSKLLGWYLQKISMRAYQTAMMYTKKYLVQLPIADGLVREPSVHLAGLVQRMLDLHQQLASAKTPVDKTALQRQIDATDRQIDQLVYELYGLTDDEIRIVEQATA